MSAFACVPTRTGHPDLSYAAAYAARTAAEVRDAKTGAVMGDIGQCVFCDIAHERSPAIFVKRWADGVFAIQPLNPVTFGHLLVIPVNHVTDFADSPMISGRVFRRAAQLAQELQLSDANLITSKGVMATQSVFHLHVHLVPREYADGLALPWDDGR